MCRWLAMNASAASNGFKVRLSRNRISRGVKPNASAMSFHSFPPVTESNIYFVNIFLKFNTLQMLVYLIAWHLFLQVFLVFSKLHKLHSRKIRKKRMYIVFGCEICSICIFRINNLTSVSSHHANVLAIDIAIRHLFHVHNTHHSSL